MSGTVCGFVEEVRLTEEGQESEERWHARFLSGCLLEGRVALPEVLQKYVFPYRLPEQSQHRFRVGNRKDLLVFPIFLTSCHSK